MSPATGNHRTDPTVPTRALPRTRSWRALAGGVACLLPLGWAQAIDLGDASVLSQQGQNLRVAVPFGSAPGAHISVTRFSVLAAEAPPGEFAPAPSDFVIAKAPRRNVVFFTAPPAFTGSALRLTVAVSDPAGSRVTYDLRVPPFRATPAGVVDEPADPAPAPRRRTRARGPLPAAR